MGWAWLIAGVRPGDRPRGPDNMLSLGVGLFDCGGGVGKRGGGVVVVFFQAKEAWMQVISEVRTCLVACPCWWFTWELGDGLVLSLSVTSAWCQASQVLGGN